MGKKYDQLAYDFIKISLTAYSLTAILRRNSYLYLFDALSSLLWVFVKYLSARSCTFMPLTFVAESATLYIYYYGWDKMREGY